MGVDDLMGRVEVGRQCRDLCFRNFAMQTSKQNLVKFLFSTNTTPKLNRKPVWHDVLLPQQCLGAA